MTPGDDSADTHGFTVEYLWEDGIPASTAIIQILCAIEAENASDDLRRSLSEYLESDVLNTLVTDGSGEERTVTCFTHAGYTISVTETGRIFVRLQD